MDMNIFGWGVRIPFSIAKEWYESVVSAIKFMGAVIPIGLVILSWSKWETDQRKALYLVLLALFIHLWSKSL